MKARTIKLVIVLLAFMPVCPAGAIEGAVAVAFTGRDIHIGGGKSVSLHGSSGKRA